MSGSYDDRRPAEPLEFTDAEVRELAGRRTKPVAAIARLKRLVPAESTGRLVSDLDVPARITRKGLPAMRRAGRRSDKILRLLAPSDLPAEQILERKDLRLKGPTRKPPAADS